jgi:Rod binding domain-containing protein
MEAVGNLNQNAIAGASAFGQPEQLRLMADRMTAEKRAEVAKEFEAVFSSMLVKQMRESLTEGMFGSDSGDVYGGLFDLFLGRHMAEAQPIGIDKMVKAYLDRGDK